MDTNKQRSSIPYDGIPFVHVGEKVLWYHQGKDKNEKAKQKNEQKAQERQVTKAFPTFNTKKLKVCLIHEADITKNKLFWDLL